MIVLYHPKSTKPRSRRFPLSILSLAAVIEGRGDYTIVDGNVDPHPLETIATLLCRNSVELLAVSVMPGPQMVSAANTCQEFRARHPDVPIVWGGYFPSIYTEATLNAPYVDFAVRGQGEDTFIELLQALRGARGLETVRGLSYKDAEGIHRHNPERPMRGPDAFPWHPYHRLEAEKYILPTFLGKRTAVHQASVGCPYRCNFCGVVSAYGSREKMESPARTEAILRHLARTYGVDAIQFYDNNFFLREDHARELADRLAPLGVRWWRWILGMWNWFWSPAGRTSYRHVWRRDGLGNTLPASNLSKSRALGVWCALRHDGCSKKPGNAWARRSAWPANG